MTAERREAVLALGCDCAERLDAEAERLTRTTRPRQSGKRAALDRAVRLHDAAEFLKSNPAGVNVTTPGPAVPGSSEGLPMTGAPLDADEAVPAPAGSLPAGSSDGLTDDERREFHARFLAGPGSKPERIDWSTVYDDEDDLT